MYPNMHLQAVSWMLPAMELVPLGHNKQLGDASVVVYVPVGHSIQLAVLVV
jgi:hypothetical protein